MKATQRTTKKKKKNFQQINRDKKKKTKTKVVSKDINFSFHSLKNQKKKNKTNYLQLQIITNRFVKVILDLYEQWLDSLDRRHFNLKTMGLQ